MRELNHLSTRPSSPQPRAKRSVLLSSCVALPLLCGALGCSGSNSDSQVSGMSGSTGSSLSGGPDIIVPSANAGSGGISNGSGGTDPGVYMLPAGFTKTDLGGYKLGPAVDATMTGSGGASSGGDSSTSCGTQILGVVRDFKGINEPDGHPDFEHFSGSNASPGIVEMDLGSDQKPVYASPADSPFIDPNNGQQTTNKMDFDEWYRATANVNKPYLVYLYFEPSDGVSTFQSTAFFPLDGAGWGNTCNEPDATCPKQAHNFGFTTEVHTRFSYKGGETFSFTGDDDLWVFINNKLAIDLGGLHSKTSDTISLDQKAKALGISVGKTYALDLFHAERHTNASNFRVDTNLSFTNCGTVIEEPPVK
jgi:fibro-slime domain-containing protein